MNKVLNALVADSAVRLQVFCDRICNGRRDFCRFLGRFLKEILSPNFTAGLLISITWTYFRINSNFFYSLYSLINGFRSKFTYANLSFDINNQYQDLHVVF